MASLRTPALHETFIEALGESAKAASDVTEKPLLVDCELPLPRHLRVYAYNLVGGIGTKRDFEYKAVLRVPNHPVGEKRNFDYGGGRFVVNIAYREDLDVWILWDASLQQPFTNGRNIQVRTDTVTRAAATGFATQERHLQGGTVETVLVCTTPNLPSTLIRRVDLTGGSGGPSV